MFNILGLAYLYDVRTTGMRCPPESDVTGHAGDFGSITGIVVWFPTFVVGAGNEANTTSQIDISTRIPYAMTWEHDGRVRSVQGT